VGATNSSKKRGRHWAAESSMWTLGEFLFGLVGAQHAVCLMRRGVADESFVDNGS
jgi:hypothetical protein